MEKFIFEDGLRSAMQRNEKMLSVVSSRRYLFDQEFEQYKDRILGIDCAPEHLIGISTGIGAYGMYPVVRIEQRDLISSAFLQLWNISSQLRYRSGGQFIAPLTVVVEYSSALRVESLLAQIPGLEIFAPSAEADYARLLEDLPKQADPVLVFVPKVWPLMEDRLKAKWEEKLLALKQAKVLVEGDYLTLLSYGAATSQAWEIAKILAAENKNIELIDLRCISPIDKNTILASVKKTGRLAILQDSPKSFGIGAEIAAWISEQAMEHLLAPIQRIAAFDTPDSDGMSFVVQPDRERILYTIRNLSDF